MMSSRQGEHHEAHNDAGTESGTHQRHPKPLQGPVPVKRTEEFVAATGYHEKSTIGVRESFPAAKVRQTRQRPPLSTTKRHVQPSFLRQRVLSMSQS